ncbi:MAG: hypothetical protein LBQ66_02195, partial [Planctomycetaceae bacterium]|nr:hypothetical protein [Planctomycetaceae bacterium]
MAFLPNSFGFLMLRRAGCPRSSPSPLRGNCRLRQQLGRVGFVNACSAPVVGLCRRYSPRKPGGRLPTLRLP